MPPIITPITSTATPFVESIKDSPAANDISPNAKHTQLNIWLNNAFLEYVDAGGCPTIHTINGNNTGAKIHLDNLKPLTYHPFYHDSFYQNFPYNQSPQFKYKHILSIHLSDMEYNYNIVSFDTKILMINHLMLVLMHI